MASKMPRACDSSNSLIDIQAAQQKKCINPLRCEFCDALVSFVNGFTRNVGENIVVVEPFFRLIKGQVHSESCRYNIHGQITIIARESDGDILTAINNNRYELRLLAIKKTLEQLRSARETQKPETYQPIAAPEKKYIEKEGRLGAYINSAKRVLKVRSACEDSSEIENSLVLNFDGTRVPWSDFYFDDKELFRCHSQVLRATVSIPVAICGVVKMVKPIKGKTGNFTILELLRPTRISDDAEILDVACATVWSNDLTAFDEYKPNQTIVAFGLWTAKSANIVKSKNENSKIKSFRNHDLMLWPVTRSQICRA